MQLWGRNVYKHWTAWKINSSTSYGYQSRIEKRTVKRHPVGSGATRAVNNSWCWITAYRIKIVGVATNVINDMASWLKIDWKYNWTKLGKKKWSTGRLDNCTGRATTYHRPFHGVLSQSHSSLVLRVPNLQKQWIVNGPRGKVILKWKKSESWFFLCRQATS